MTKTHIRILFAIYLLIVVLMMTCLPSCKTSKHSTSDIKAADSLATRSSVTKDTASKFTVRTEQVNKEEKNTITEHSTVTPTVIYVRDSGREKPVIVYVTDTKKTTDEVINTSQLVRDSSTINELKILTTESITQTRALQEQVETLKKSNLSGNFVLMVLGGFGLLLAALIVVVIIMLKKFSAVTSIVQTVKKGL